LKNPKVAEDGSLYKVIPIEKKSADSGRKIHTDIVGALRARQAEVQAARSSVRNDINMDFSARATSMAEAFRTKLRRTVDQRQQFYHMSRTQSRSSDVSFKTVSNKQDPDKMWVRPAKDLDMTGYLMNLNTEISDTVAASANQIIDGYRREFM